MIPKDKKVDRKLRNELKGKYILKIATD